MAKHRTGHLFRRGKTFYVRWAVNGKVFSKALHDKGGNPITNRREAEDAKVKLLAPFVVGDEASALESIAGKLEGRRAELVKWDDVQNPPLPLSQTWTAFLSSTNRPDSGASTLSGYECQFSAFVEWMRENHPEMSTVREVSKEVAEEYAGALNGGRFSPNTYNKHLNLLALVFRIVKDKAKLVANPWGDIQRKRLVTHSRRELTVEELRKVCLKATGEMRTLLALGIYTGLRLGDCATLRWGEVDLGRGVIRRVPNKTARQTPTPVIIPIHGVLRDMLTATPEAERKDYVLPTTAALYARGSEALTALVQKHFISCGITLHKAGTGSNRGSDDTEVKRAVVEVGFHSLRHTFVSLCRESGAPLAVVEAIVGHNNPAMTRHYTHVGELAAGQAVAALPTLIGDAKPEKLVVPEDRAQALALATTIATSLTAQNWAAKRKDLLTVLAALTAAEVGVTEAVSTVDAK